jgi:hypothetical protein
MDDAVIRVAFRDVHVDVMDRLLQDPRVDPSDMDNAVIRVAFRDYRVDVVDRLLQAQRVDSTSINNEVICMASEDGLLDEVKRLLQSIGILFCGVGKQSLSFVFNNETVSPTEERSKESITLKQKNTR